MPDEGFPIFDAHMDFCQAYLDQVLAVYDRCGVKAGINLWGTDGRSPCNYHADYAEFLGILRERKLTHFVPFYWPEWKRFGWAPEQFVAELCGDMRRYAAMGACGLKVWKDLGMYIIHPDGTPATMDEPALDPVWETAAQLGWTIAVHQADPSVNWSTKTRTGLSREDLFARRDRVIAAHPEVRFILCHNGNDIESVEGWAALLDRFPHCLSDLGRDLLRFDTPEDVRAFLEAYADRILLGAILGTPDDRPPDEEWTLHHLYRPWRERLLSYGLSDEALHQITWGNGEREFLRSL